MKITFADSEQQTFIVMYDDGSVTLISNPPGSAEDQKIIDDYGGLYEIERTYVDESRAAADYEARYEKFMGLEARYTDSLTIDGIMKETLSKGEQMKIKMSVFKHPAVKACENKELLTKLRRSESILDIIMYFGMIKNGLL